jgi:hypothetical protein
MTFDIDFRLHGLDYAFISQDMFSTESMRIFPYDRLMFTDNFILDGRVKLDPTFIAISRTTPAVACAVLVRSIVQRRLERLVN